MKGVSEEPLKERHSGDRAQVTASEDHEVQHFLGDMQNEFPRKEPEEILQAYKDARAAIAPSEAREELLKEMHARLM